jgi:diguanylate cyclase (GGDEF)-like protein
MAEPSWRNGNAFSFGPAPADAHPTPGRRRGGPTVDPIDPLTGLPDRTLLTDRLQAAAEALACSGHQLAVIFLDGDRFDEVNDGLGHAAGDVYLVELADRLGTEIRGTDTAARLAGDEFVVLLPDLVDAGEAVTIGERLRRALERPVRWSGGEIPVSLSGGIATLAPGDPDPRAVLRRADEARHRAKQAGRGRFVLAGPR